MNFNILRRLGFPLRESFATSLRWLSIFTQKDPRPRKPNDVCCIWLDFKMLPLTSLTRRNKRVSHSLFPQTISTPISYFYLPKTLSTRKSLAIFVEKFLMYSAQCFVALCFVFVFCIWYFLFVFAFAPPRPFVGWAWQLPCAL